MLSPLRLARLATLPQTRRLLMAAVRSPAVREFGHRARTDRSGLARELRDPAVTAGLVREAIGHPAARELADIGLLMLPGRYLPIGWAAAWLSRRILGRSRSASKLV